MAESNIEVIMRGMLEIQQKSRRFADLLCEGESLSQTQLILLIQMKINNGLKASQIAEFLSVTPGAVTSICDKLEKLGHIKRVRENEDRRVVKMVLTDSGEKKVEELFLKFPQGKLEEIEKVLLQVNQLMSTVF
ncbi:DNA-binding transcriptional regulator, MarR family [Gracilibacillus ureilyticus]|uniref:DNA-binding transcriptional regulator, MarR family n=1 Tax=Gracilibacillus ureilyticus TaxID=531814 RepID=A0A1H9V3K5_9BACI|nr:MarR family transcriptional regulator [Gracilibacillus ureilyticus]SES15883.1 DNA-binding transcriptional regulator, MarR family [Gracilibacillus ureilyticus]